MKKWGIIISVTLLTALQAFAQKDAFAGFYKGEAQSSVYPTKEEKILFVQVTRTPNETYKLSLITRPFVRSDVHFVAENLKADADGSRIEFRNLENNGFRLSGVVSGDGSVELDGVSTGFRGRERPFSFRGTRYEYKSPTLGLKAPAGATVLFDGSTLENFRADDKRKSACNWLIIKNDDGQNSMCPDTSIKYVSAESRRVFNGKLRVHAEYKMPTGKYYEFTGDFRANSGLYIGPYEIQIISGFGLEPRWNDCGAIYRQTPPMVNACLEDGVWETYDVEFTPARYDGSLLVSVPRMTVRQNGILIHNNTPVYRATTLMEAEAKNYVHPVRDFRIMLQNHTDPVEFRNVWVVEE